MPLTFEDAFKKDDFYQLAPNEQRKVLGSLNSDFAGLPEVEQNKVIGKYKLGYLNSKEFASAHPGSARDYSTDLGPSIKRTFGEMGSTLANDAMNLPGGIAQAARHPIDTGKAILQKQANEATTAAERFKQGRYSEAFGHGLAYLLPVVGPMAADIGEEFAEHPGAASAHIAEAAAPELTKALPTRIPIRNKPLARNVNNPEVNQALRSVKGRVRMTPGQETGNLGLKRVEASMENLPGASSRATEFFHGQEDDLAREARRLAEKPNASKPSPNTANAYGAGQGIQGRLTDRIVKLKNQTNNLYDQVRTAAAANKQTVQTGTRPTGLVGPTGQALVAPVTKVFESPVPLPPLRSSLKPIYDDLMENMPEVRRQNSPAFRALDNLMTSDATHMSAMDFDKFLGAVKALARQGGKSEYLTSQSQRLALKIINEGEKSLDTALRGAGPKVTTRLKSGRETVKAYYKAGELRAEFSGEAATVYNRLTAKGDRMVDHLKELQATAPHELLTVARTYLEGLVEKSTREGGFGRAAGVMEDWRTMGPETKKLLFGPERTKDLDEFFLAAKTLTRPLNPSGSGHMMATLGGLGVTGRALLAVLRGDYATALETGAIGYGMPSILSRVLFNPGGAKLFTQAIKLPVRTPAGRAAQSALRVRILQATTQWKREQQEQTQEQPASDEQVNP